MADVVREIKNDDDEKPVLILRKKPTVTGTFKLERPGIKSFAIRLQDIWMYSEEHNPTRREYRMCPMCGLLVLVTTGFEALKSGFDFCCYGKSRGYVEFLCELFDLGLPMAAKESMLTTVIQEGIDDLIKLPPPAQNIKIIGECDYQIRAIRGEQTDIRGTTPIRDLVPVKED